MRFVKRDAIFFHFPVGSINGGVFRYSDSWSHSNCHTYLLHFSISFFVLSLFVGGLGIGCFELDVRRRVEALLLKIVGISK